MSDTNDRTWVECEDSSGCARYDATDVTSILADVISAYDCALDAESRQDREAVAAYRACVEPVVQQLSRCARIGLREVAQLEEAIEAGRRAAAKVYNCDECNLGWCYRIAMRQD